MRSIATCIVIAAGLLAGCDRTPAPAVTPPAIAPARASALVDPAGAAPDATRVDASDAALAARVAARVAQALGPAASGTVQVRVRGGVVTLVPLTAGAPAARDVAAALRGVTGLRALDTRALP